MKNSLIYFYNIYVIDLNIIQNNYYFSYQNRNYIIEKLNRSIDELPFLYKLNTEMIMSNVPVFKIILTKDNNVSFFYENEYYVLMQLSNFKNRILTINDIINFSYIPKERYDKLDKSNWGYFWENKIDYIEYQFIQMKNKYPLIDNSIDYYIGIWENAISFYNSNIKSDNFPKIVCHKRIGSNDDLMCFYDPLNFVIDYKERDVAEYIKSYIYSTNYTKENIYNFLNSIPKKYNTIIRLISRILFPSNYFDLYEEIIIENNKEQNLFDIINKNTNYERLIVFVFDFYKEYNIPYIEWIIKKD